MNMDFIRTNIQSCKTCYNKENYPSKCLGCVTHGDDISDFRLQPKIDEYLVELETKATAYDSKVFQDAIECDRIKSQLLSSIFKLEYQFFFNEVTISMWINPDDFKLFTEKTKLEALTKALEWVEGRV